MITRPHRSVGMKQNSSAKRSRIWSARRGDWRLLRRIAYQPRQSGNTPAGLGRRRHTLLAVILSEWAITVGRLRTQAARRTQSPPNWQTHGACLTCMATCSSGVRTGTRRNWLGVKIRSAPAPAKAKSGAAVVGIRNSTSAALRIATAVRRMSASTAPASASFLSTEYPVASLIPAARAGFIAARGKDTDPNKLFLDLADIPAGSFTMGSAETEAGRRSAAICHRIPTIPSTKGERPGRRPRRRASIRAV